MKSIIKKALLGLALSSCAAFASATAFTSTVRVDPVYDETSTLKLFAFDSSNLYDDTTGDLIKASAGDTFTFDYLFNLPDAQSYFAFLVNGDTHGLAFDSASFGYFPIDWYGSIDGVITGFSTGNAYGSGYLDSATYDLRLTGTYLADNGGFTGILAADPAGPVSVPEPMSLSLIGLGLAGIAGLRRRKAA